MSRSVSSNLWVNFALHWSAETRPNQPGLIWATICEYLQMFLKIIHLCRRFLKDQHWFIRGGKNISETHLLYTPADSFTHFIRNLNWYRASVRRKRTEKWSKWMLLSILLIRGKHRQPNDDILPVKTPPILFQYIITLFNLFRGIKWQICAHV